MAEELYTPTTARVLDAYIWCDMASTSDEWDAARTAEFDRWLAGVKADAWDACVSQAEACGYIGLNDASELESIFNPYRQEAQR